MKTYKLYVCMQSVKFEAEVVADCFSIKDNRISFYKEYPSGKLEKFIASYPSSYTIIESIKENK
tara:strand:- start:1441 stop:1632 length:192 start_codon:yes stop_codon:yes gene_type:complete